jgi:CRP-like cAMP-binding protein
MPVSAAAVDDLKSVPLFSDLEGRQLKKLASHFRERSVAPGTTLVREGEMSGVGFFVVAGGEAVVSAGGRDLKTLGPGDHFGEIALMQGADRTATVRATTDLSCFALSPGDFRDVVEGNPAIAWKVMQSLAERLE